MLILDEAWTQHRKYVQVSQLVLFCGMRSRLDVLRLWCNREFGESEMLTFKALLYAMSWEINDQRRQKETKEHLCSSGDQPYCGQFSLILRDVKPKWVRSLCGYSPYALSCLTAGVNWGSHGLPWLVMSEGQAPAKGICIRSMTCPSSF